jgi:hypothetical protein
VALTKRHSPRNLEYKEKQMNTKLMNMLVLVAVILVLTMGVSVAFAAPPLQDNPTATPTALLATTEPITDSTGLTTTNEAVATATPAAPTTTEPLTDSTTVTTTDTTSNPSALPATGGVWPTSLVLLITLLAAGAALTVTGFIIMGEFSRRNR